MKKWLVGGIGAAVVVMTVVLGVVLWPRRYELSAEYYDNSEEYYDNSELHEINVDELKGLIDGQKSFALLIYQPNCRASEDFEKIVTEFSEKEKVTFEKVGFSEVKNSGLVEGLTYYPSVALYKDGKLQTFLKTDDDADLAAYQGLGGFEGWWRKYISK